jgi:hypothetical protein
VLHGEPTISMKPHCSSSTWKQACWRRFVQYSHTVLMLLRELTEAQTAAHNNQEM